MVEIKLSDLGERYAFVDPASGKKDFELKRISARSAIIVIAQDWLSRVFVLHAWAKRCSTDELIEQMYATSDAFQPKVFGGEASGLQGLFQDAVMRDARYRGRHLPLKKVMQPTRIEKDYRIRTTLQPYLGNGRLFLRDDMTELKTELGGFPLTPLKDLVDALASAIRLIPPRQTRPEKHAEAEAYLAYLRKNGAPPHYIEEVARRKGITTSWFSNT